MTVAVRRKSASASQAVDTRLGLVCLTAGDWQLARISNGAASFHDSRHSELITQFPSALFSVSWVEVEAKGKEKAIQYLRRLWPALK